MILEDITIIIAEDNFINRTTFQVSLMLAGAQVIFERFGNGMITLAKRYQHQKIDLIILDIMLMGGVSGYTLFEEIRTLPQYKNVPIIAVSATDSSEAIARCKALGFNGYIAKPIDERTFPHQLARIIKGEELWIGN